MSRPTIAEINLNNLKHNWNLLSDGSQSDRIILVVKANAYGHELSLIIQPLLQMGVKRLAVSMLDEAKDVRKMGFKGELLILGPIFKDEWSEIIKLELTPVVSDKDILIDLANNQFTRPIHIKWDTGMHRLGLSMQDTLWFKELLDLYPNLNIQAFCTHFLKGDDFYNPNGFSQRQLGLYEKILGEFPSINKSHLFNSDSFLAMKNSGKFHELHDARLGLALYGYSSISLANDNHKLKPVMTLKTKIVHLIEIGPGESVSYNASWTAQRKSRIAVLPIGYADGYPRSLSNKGQVFIRGQIVPLVGIVCMDYLMIDVTDVSNVSQGDDVELWGNQLSLEMLAKLAGTIPYELMTSLSSRVPRKLGHALV